MVSGLPEEYQSMTSSVRSAAPGSALAHGDVEQRLAAHRDVALGAVVEGLPPLALEDVEHPGAVDPEPGQVPSATVPKPKWADATGRLVTADEEHGARR